MAVSFGGVTLPAASKLAGTHVIAIRDALLLSGKHKIQSNANTVINPRYRCMGSWAEYEAVLALVGTPGTLITEQEPGGYGTCSIAKIEILETDNPSYVYFDVEFKRDTS